MGLNVTVSKGHDFSTGNVTRAALNAGATPTIAVTGSVGESEIASGAITNAKVKTNADIAVDKLALASGKIIIGATNGNASALSGTSSFSSVASETEGNAGLLVDVGDKFEVLKTNTLAVSTDDINDGKQYLNGDSALSIHKVTTDGVTTNNLRIKHINNSVHGNHISTANALDNASIGKNSAGKLEIKDNGVHHQKLYAYKDSNGDPKSGFLTYGAGGAAYVVQASGANQLAVTSAANGNPELRTFDKEVDLGHFTAAQQWKRTAHGLTNPSGSSAVCPTSVSFYLECTNHDNAHGYAVGDRMYNPDLRNGENNNGFTVTSDKTYVMAHVQAGGDIQLPKKCGGNTSVLDADGNPTGSTHVGTDQSNFVFDTYKDDFKVIVRVCG